MWIFVIKQRFCAVLTGLRPFPRVPFSGWFWVRVGWNGSLPEMWKEVNQWPLFSESHCGHIWWQRQAQGAGGFYTVITIPYSVSRSSFPPGPTDQVLLASQDSNLRDYERQQPSIDFPLPLCNSALAADMNSWLPLQAPFCAPSAVLQEGWQKIFIDFPTPLPGPFLPKCLP